MNLPDDPDGSISKAIARANQFDEHDAQLLWDRFFERLCRFSKGKIYDRHRRFMDPEDVASSAMFALIDGLKKGDYHNVKNRNQLWQMLVMIATRKATNRGKFFDRDKRGGKRIRGQSALDQSGFAGFGTADGQSDDPAKFVEIEMTCRELLIALPDDSYRQIALMRLAGFTNQEISVKFSCSTRTIDRKLTAIRQVWNELGLDDSQ